MTFIPKFPGKISNLYICEDCLFALRQGDLEVLPVPNKSQLMPNRCVLFLALFLVVHVPIISQDPFFISFRGSESYFNPAMTGIKGSRSLGLKYKNQWWISGIKPFQTGAIQYEESLPCLPFDYGLGFGFDEEGDGLLRTYDLGAKVAGGPTTEIGKGLLNLRLGLNAQFTQKKVDFSRFVFSDQLDPKYGPIDAYGIPNPTNFVPPNETRSLILFTPTVGFVVNYLSNQKGYRPMSLQFGGALHNAYSLGRPRNGNTESLLGLETDIPDRYNLFLRAEFIPVNRRGNFFSVSPSVFHQKQGGLSYWEGGLRMGLNRFAGTGLYYHTSVSRLTGASTNWMSLYVDFGDVINDYRGRVDVGGTFSWSKSGLKNFVGPIFELSVTYHWARSMVCRTGRRGEDYTGQRNDPVCPTWTFTNERKRMYENIWYKTIYRKLQ